MNESIPKTDQINREKLMGMYDYYLDAPDGYSEQLKCWGCEMKGVKDGDKVPRIDGNSTYSILLQTYDDVPSRYLHVVVGQLKGSFSFPMRDFSIYDKWAREVVDGVQQLSPVSEELEKFWKEKGML